MVSGGRVVSVGMVVSDGMVVPPGRLVSVVEGPQLSSAFGSVMSTVVGTQAVVVVVESADRPDVPGGRVTSSPVATSWISKAETVVAAGAIWVTSAGSKPPHGGLAG